MIGKITVAGVSIGNILDIPQRTMMALRDADVIVTESVLSTTSLIRFLKIETAAEFIEYLPWFDQPGINKNQHIVEKIVDEIKSGKNVVLVSTEGMPLIHDPGYEIILAVRKEQLPITVIAGPSAPIAALNVSGLDSWKFTFESDMPTDKQEKANILSKIKKYDRTSIFFEKDHNIIDTLEQAKNIISGLRPACICINLTMDDELILRGSISDLLDWCNNNNFIKDHEEQNKICLLFAGTNYYGNENENIN